MRSSCLLKDSTYPIPSSVRHRTQSGDMFAREPASGVVQSTMKRDPPVTHQYVLGHALNAASL